jgi:UDP-MurNAc hydroxylase
MQMEWVNHASFIIRSGAISLLCDPWLEGTTFNDGWTLLSPTRLSYDDFASISHIWFSNERPDRFNEATLEKIPKLYRERIKVLVHHTKNKRVLNSCRELGFASEELCHWQAFELAPGFRMMCGMQGAADSWSAIFAEDKTLLNMNGCTFDKRRDLDTVKQHVGRVTVLLSQFSYAHWVGNPEDAAAQKKYAEHKIAEIARQIQIFQPERFVPSASYFFFSHAENAYLNRHANCVEDVFQYATRQLATHTVVLYPGDRWQVGCPHNSAESVRRYKQDSMRTANAARAQGTTVSVEQLQEAGREFVRKSLKENNQLLLNSLPPAIAYVSDLDQQVELSLNGLKLTEGQQADIEVSSDSLLDCFTSEHGGETLFTNGRFRIPRGGRPRRFFWIFPAYRQTGVRTSLNLKFLGRQAGDRTQAAVGGQ